MATAKKTTTKKTAKKEEVVVPEETKEEVVAEPIKVDTTNYNNLSPFGRLQAGYGVK